MTARRPSLGDEVFRTTRLLVRHWRGDDAPAVLALYGDPDVAKWTSTPEPMTDLDEAVARLEGWKATRDDQRGFGIWAITVDGHGDDEPIGIVLLRQLGDTSEVEIGWSLRTSAHGQGFATEASAGAIEHARRHGHGRIRAIMWPDNEPSVAVCGRLGMTHLGIVDDPWHGSPEFPTSRMFVLDVPG